MEGYIGGIALPTNVTLGKCIPSMCCVVDVYVSSQWERHTRKFQLTIDLTLCFAQCVLTSYCRI